MPGILTRGVLLLFFCLITPNVSAQSEAAFLRAGDDAMRKKDPVAATAFYMEALEYNASVRNMQKIAKAWKARYNYPIAITWYQKILSEAGASGPDEDQARTELYDLYKRSDQLQRSQELLAKIGNTKTADSLREDYKAFTALNSINANVFQLPSSVNSAYSDFAPVLYGDSVLIFSSNRIKSNKTGKSSSRIYRSSITGNQFTDATMMTGAMNHSGKHTANLSMSEDGKLIVFTICNEDEDNFTTCLLYESRFTKKGWEPAVKLSDSLNFPGFTSTQPCIRTNREKGYILYFVSNNEKGKGGMDIWQAERDASGKYSRVQNLDEINTAFDELTPYYDRYTDTLYFASDRNGGAGGLDLWKIKPGSKLVVNAGLPYNSGYDEVYPYLLPPDSSVSARHLYLASNRPPAKTFKGEPCCFDIFRISPVPDTSASDSVVTPDLADLIRDTLSYVQGKDSALKLLLPLRLYFDNDYPDPKSRSSETRAQYSALLNDYLQKEEEFIRYATNPAEKNKVESFFRDSVQGSLYRLEQFSSGILDLVKLGYSLEITLQGSASPLADSRYNLILSERRIGSLLNDWLSDGPEELKNAIRDGIIAIKRDAAGESLSEQQVNDRADRVGESVYGLAASQLRRIEITGITIKKL